MLGPRAGPRRFRQQLPRRRRPPPPEQQNKAVSPNNRATQRRGTRLERAWGGGGGVCFAFWCADVLEGQSGGCRANDFIIMSTTTPTTLPAPAPAPFRYRHLVKHVGVARHYYRPDMAWRRLSWSLGSVVGLRGATLVAVMILARDVCFVDHAAQQAVDDRVGHESQVLASGVVRPWGTAPPANLAEGGFKVAPFFNDWWCRPEVVRLSLPVASSSTPTSQRKARTSRTWASGYYQHCSGCPATSWVFNNNSACSIARTGIRRIRPFPCRTYSPCPYNSARHVVRGGPCAHGSATCCDEFHWRRRVCFWVLQSGISFRSFRTFFSSWQTMRRMYT